MRTWIANLWLAATSGFWFLPTMMLLAGAALAVLGPMADREWGDWVPASLETTPTTARATLAALCGAMITITGVVCSTTVVAISITSAQLGPRLLRNFLGQSVTQATIGVCLGTSVYCLLLLRWVDKYEGTAFVPQMSVLLASLLSLATLLMIVYFIHRVAHSMQSHNVASDVAHDLDAAVDRLFPESIGDEASDDCDEDQKDPKRQRAEDRDKDEERHEQEAWRREWETFDEAEIDTVTFDKDGYLQAIDMDGLMTVAKRRDVCLRLRARPGDFVRSEEVLLESMPADRLKEDDLQRLHGSFLLGNQRTTQQDVECAVNELVEVAVRALSPGVNDPFTAITCVDRLGGVLRRLARRKLPSGVRADDDGEPRVVARPRRFDTILSAAFDQIRQNSVSVVSVSLRLLEALEAIDRSVVRQGDRVAIARQADLVLEGARSAGLTEADLKDLEERRSRFGQQQG
ncbi:hypothetical protein Mal64_00370 [Pseudobythopirellula maris]|uniref:DUF2254 domain-containing protein n=1 Tax=Pseudobythopirellula maris TaxID=2527991 RepID=A0A5C5ZRH6_9BACT|nr:DUF2254 domain-containing protein [Pseudobythopirellula maris]TWT89658.1 hypothetical protein Mal64_00370 [Pseudobythopirellula maris]